MLGHAERHRPRIDVSAGETARQGNNLLTVAATFLDACRRFDRGKYSRLLRLGCPSSAERDADLAVACRAFSGGSARNSAPRWPRYSGKPWAASRLMRHQTARCGEVRLRAHEPSLFCDNIAGQGASLWDGERDYSPLRFSVTCLHGRDLASACFDHPTLLHVRG